MFLWAGMPCVGVTGSADCRPWLCDQVSEVVNEEARDADLVVLEGMGRAIETNLNARFRCDALKIGMIKHREVRSPPRHLSLKHSMDAAYVCGTMCFCACMHACMRSCMCVFGLVGVCMCECV